MFEQLEQINARPEPFEFYTAADLWTDEHTSEQMLAYHLNTDIDVASRRGEFIDQSAEWIGSREYRLVHCFIRLKKPSFPSYLAEVLFFAEIYSRMGKRFRKTFSHEETSNYKRRRCKSQCILEHSFSCIERPKREPHASRDTREGPRGY